MPVWAAAILAAAVVVGRMFGFWKLGNRTIRAAARGGFTPSSNGSEPPSRSSRC